MITFTAGRFKAEVRGPYPMWIWVSDEKGGQITGIRHDELSDLRHVIERAREAARNELRRSNHDGEVP